MMAARVAGVPRPVSFMASESSLSSRVLPAVSIAVSSVPSVKRLGGRMLFFTALISITSCGWPFARSGGKTSSARCSSLPPSLPLCGFLPAEISRTFQPTCCTAVPDV